MKSIPIALLALSFQTFPVFAQSPADHESTVVLNAADLLPASVLKGTSHRFRELVVTDGFMAHFEIDSDFGTLEATGVPQAINRVAEIEAMRKLVDTSKTDLFAEGMKRSITRPVDAVKNIVTDPVTSIKRAPKTVGHFFSKIGTTIERTVNQVQEGIERDDSPSGAEIAGGISETAKRASGFDKARLDTAKQLGVDPYSDNTRLKEEMDKVTWAFFAGGLPLRIGAAVASAGVAVAATNMVGVPDETYALTQTELTLRDQNSLAAIGIRQADIDAFMIQPNLSTTKRHRIVKVLEAMPTCAGRGRIILLANALETIDQSNFLVSALEILASRQQSAAADYKELFVFGRLPGAMTASGSLEVPAPVDHVTWTDKVAAFASRDDLGTSPKTLVHTGKLSPATTAGLSAAGWKTIAIPYPGMP